MTINNRILYAVMITGCMIVLFLIVYKEMHDFAEEESWQEFEMMVDQEVRIMSTQFENDIAKLHIMKEMLLSNGLDEDCLDYLHLNAVLPTALFSRIDIWYPDDTLLSDGIDTNLFQDFDFDEILKKGEHMSQRRRDPQTGNESVYYALPIAENGETLAILIAVYDLEKISEKFHSTLYDRNTQIAIVDRRDGKFIIDSWHDRLGDIYDSGDRKRAAGYEDIDLQQEIVGMKTGTIVFQSATTGQLLYMYYTPTGLFDWQILVFAEERVIFESMEFLRKIFLTAGIAVIFMLIVYFFWSYRTVKLLDQTVSVLKKKEKLLREIGYRDAITSMYNRMKYSEVWQSLSKESLQQVGIAYLDLNGLKRINDTQSHEAGDMYICSAAEIISRFFAENSYRVGGDEFVILQTDIPQETFTNKINKMKTMMEEKGVSVSIGSCWQDSCDDLKGIQDLAEKQMYAQKKSYYLVHNRRSKK